MGEHQEEIWAELQDKFFGVLYLKQGRYVQKGFGGKDRKVKVVP